MKIIQPDTIAKPGSSYAQAVLLPAGGERLIIAGQIGIRSDGSIVEGLEAQLEQAWSNIFAILDDAGFRKTDLVRVFGYVTVPGQVGVFRNVRDRVLDGHLCPHTYLEIAGLASPELLCEIEAEAVRSA